MSAVSAAEGRTKKAKLPFPGRCEGHRKEIFFRVFATAQAVMRNSSGAGGHRSGGSVAMPAAAHSSGFWSGSGVGMSAIPAVNEPDGYRPDILLNLTHFR
jgi:hypothetical protein